MESLLALSVTQNVSDLHLSSGEKVIIRQNGKLIRLNNIMLSAHQLKNKLYSILTAEQLQKIELERQLDFAYENPQIGRLRGHIFYQKKGISACFRVINRTIQTLDEIDAPEILKKIVLKEQGLILITGATGSGKSTTLAAMIEYINQNIAKHIITLEEPIEFIYKNKYSLIQQREISLHCHSYSEGLKAILRQDPDVIMIGELRDQATISAALQAAETGHLVLATLHTNSAISTINRIIDVFPDESRNFVRSQLAQSLQAIISQKLINHEELTRKAVFEILINTAAVSNLILEGKIKQIFSVIQMGKADGMKTFD